MYGRCVGTEVAALGLLNGVVEILLWMTLIKAHSGRVEDIAVGWLAGLPDFASVPLALDLQTKIFLYRILRA